MQALVRRLDSLTEMRQIEANRLEVATTEAVRESLAEHLAFLDGEVARTEGLIRSHIDSHPGLREQRNLLLSIPGIGDTTAAKLLGEILDVKLYAGARQLAAFSGLAPRLQESGSSLRRRARLSKTGAPQLRKALYFPAVVAIRHNPYVKELRERLKERGKCPMQVIGAAMRKLVHLAYGVLKTGRPFDPEWSQKQKQLDSQHSISPARKDCERHPISRMTSNVIRVGCRPLLYVVGFEG